jgi:hypothetical protein
MPTNKLLEATSSEDACPQTRVLIVKWNILHSIRTALGVVLRSPLRLRFHEDDTTELPKESGNQLGSAVNAGLILTHLAQRAPK